MKILSYGKILWKAKAECRLLQEYAVGLFIPFKPVVEGDIPGALLPYHPKKLYADLANDVPYMTGILSDEGALWSSGE